MKEIKDIVEELMGKLRLLQSRNWSDEGIAHNLPQSEARKLLTNTLQSRDKEFRGLVEGKRIPLTEEPIIRGAQESYNQALDDVLSQLPKE